MSDDLQLNRWTSFIGGWLFTLTHYSVFIIYNFHCTIRLAALSHSMPISRMTATHQTTNTIWHLTQIWIMNSACKLFTHFSQRIYAVPTNTQYATAATETGHSIHRPTELSCRAMRNNTEIMTHNVIGIRRFVYAALTCVCTHKQRVANENACASPEYEVKHSDCVRTQAKK